MRRHPVIGYDLFKGIPGMKPEILDGVRHHHEYLDVPVIPTHCWRRRFPIW